MKASSTTKGALRNLDVALTRDFEWVFNRQGSTFKVQTAPPIGRLQWDCLEFWITRTDLPAYAQVAYHVYNVARRFNEASVGWLIELLMDVGFTTCKECRLEPALGKGACATNHVGVCEMCHIADPHDLYSQSYDTLVEEAKTKLSSVREAYANGHRFTLLIEGSTHDNCPETCQTCRDGFRNLDRQARYLEVEHHFKKYPGEKAVEKVFEKHAFGFCTDVDVMDTEHWVEDREDKLNHLQALRRDFEAAKKAHAVLLNESAAQAQRALARNSIAARAAGKGPSGAQGPTA
ncbi:hypothetical protein [Hydrogenophaga sp.]|uniref:hypothetical protein n=1 Tax=Hydrogenophaga sp. TaxID=1904254 RepID=UPI00272925BE|nr:hypothetical protein [Hydrogenophaga sp.]MDO9133999.1 hypothetical protein [Hydrogenophaga sp.]